MSSEKTPIEITFPEGIAPEHAEAIGAIAVAAIEKRLRQFPSLCLGDDPFQERAIDEVARRHPRIFGCLEEAARRVLLLSGSDGDFGPLVSGSTVIDAWPHEYVEAKIGEETERQTERMVAEELGQHSSYNSCAYRAALCLVSDFLFDRYETQIAHKRRETAS